MAFSPPQWQPQWPTQCPTQWPPQWWKSTTNVDWFSNDGFHWSTVDGYQWNPCHACQEEPPVHVSRGQVVSAGFQVDSARFHEGTLPNPPTPTHVRTRSRKRGSGKNKPRRCIETLNDQPRRDQPRRDQPLRAVRQPQRIRIPQATDFQTEEEAATTQVQKCRSPAKQEPIPPVDLEEFIANGKRDFGYTGSGWGKTRDNESRIIYGNVEEQGQQVRMPSGKLVSPAWWHPPQWERRRPTIFLRIKSKS